MLKSSENKALSLFKFGVGQGVEGALTGAIYVGVDKFYWGKQLDQHELMVGAVSAGSDFLVDTLTELVSLRQQPFMADVGRMLDPLVSGVLYSVADEYLFKQDNKSLLHKFLSQVGASLIADNVSQPVQNLLGF